MSKKPGLSVASRQVVLVDLSKRLRGNGPVERTLILEASAAVRSRYCQFDGLNDAEDSHGRWPRVKWFLALQRMTLPC